MAKHDVTMVLHTSLLRKKDTQLTIKSDGKKLGTLLISQGNIEWVPSGNSANKKQMSWERFAQLMTNEGEDVRI